MPLLAVVGIPTPAALELARNSDPATAGDLGYVVKTALAEYIGRDVVRPFRVTGWDVDRIRVLGWLTTPDVPKVEKSSGLTFEVLSWEVAEGQELSLDVHFMPMVSITRAVDPATGRRIGQGTRDAFVGRPGETRIGSYSVWLREKFNAPDTGCRIASFPRFRKAELVKIIRKGTDRTYKTIQMGMGECSLKVAVTDRDRFHAFLRTGVGRQRGLGFGLLVPQELLDDVA